MDAGALAGIRVLEFSQIVAGPYLGCILSDLGAEVVKVAPVPRRAGVATVPPAYAYSGHRGMKRALLDLKADGGRGAEVAIEAVGRPDVWETTVAMVRKGGQAIFYGGPPGGTRMVVDAPALHYDQITLQGVFHNTPAHVAQALEILADPALPWEALLSTTLPLASLPQAFELMMNREALKVVIVPATSSG